MRRLLLVLAGLVLTTGCSIEQRMPVREVAYDFSDYAYYDRPYAESPEYLTSHSGPESTAQVESGNSKAQRNVEPAQDDRETHPSKAVQKNDMGMSVEGTAHIGTNQANVSLHTTPAH